MKKALLLGSMLVACFLLLDSQHLFNATQASSLATSHALTAVTIGGRIQTAEGRGIYGATARLTDANGNLVATSLSSPFGYYRFFEVETGMTYTVSVSGKGNRFTPQVISVTGENLDINFTPQ